MREREPMTQTMNASEARQRWSATLNRVFRREARVVVEKSGIPVAAIVSMDDLERLKWLEEAREAQFQALDDARAAFRDVPDEELEAEVRAALGRAREELRRRRVGA